MNASMCDKDDFWNTKSEVIENDKKKSNDIIILDVGGIRVMYNIVTPR